MDRQVRTGDTVLIKTKSRELTAVVARGRRVKDDRKQNTLAPLVLPVPKAMEKKSPGLVSRCLAYRMTPSRP